MANEESRMLPSDLGAVKIADEVVSIIAGMAAADIDGVSSMSGGIGGGIAEVLGRRNLSKGVKVEVGEEEAKIDVFIIVDYGARIPDVAWNIQESVKKAIETMTGLRVSQVNIHVQGVQFPEEESEPESETEMEPEDKEGEEKLSEEVEE
ncbi:MAG: Asp23/Gls24 family envelope stress response protein [Bacillota bacterium]|nr:Asp23/Gls24 family envelope stress response protein [Bacillota bacterium]